MTNDQLNIAELQKLAEAVKGWGNCNKAWLDSSEDVPAATVGHITEDGETYPVAVIDCDQYYQAQDSLKLAKFYAAANPKAVLSLIERIKELEKAAGESYALIDKLLRRVIELEKQNTELREASGCAENLINNFLWVSHHANRCDDALEKLRAALASSQQKNGGV